MAGTHDSATTGAAIEPALADLLERLEITRLSGPVTQDHVTSTTPMGANLVADGATFRVWAPNEAIEVYIRVSDRPDIINGPGDTWVPIPERRLRRNSDGTWTGFLRGVRDGDYYRFFLANRGGQPYKRDPYARELEFYGYPDGDCIVRDPTLYPWHDQNFRTPPFNDLVIYQFHIGRFHAVDERGEDARQFRVGKFLDVLDKIPHLARLGVNAIQPLPIVEFEGPYSLGYNGKDIYSPEMDYAAEPEDLAPYIAKVNRLLTNRGCQPLTRRQLEGQVNQLKALIDICHLYGIAVILDVVYNHAGHFGDDDESIYFFDRAVTGDQNESLYFTDKGWAGGLVFAFWKKEVRQFLIENATFFLNEYHVNGFRYDEVTVIDDHGGWDFCKELTNAAKRVKPEAIHIAEYWRDDPSWVIRDTRAGGAGFDAVWYPGMRKAVRNAIAQAAGGCDAAVSMDAVRDALYRPGGFDAAWRTVQCLETHDRQRLENTNDREPRLAALGDTSDTRSWYARSRARVANGLLLTAPGIPMLFMGQEILEDKYWSDSPNPGALVWWDGLDQDPHMQDHFRFVRDLIGLRHQQPALRGESINVFHVHEGNRIIAFHRWLEGSGRDVVVIASLNESTFWQYDLGFPLPGRWLEALNSNAYGNPEPIGNRGAVDAHADPLHGFAHSAAVTVTANSIMVFVRA